MCAAPYELDELLERLNNARLVDEEIHRNGASLEQRVVSHDALVHIRSELVKLRTESGLEPMDAAGLHDSRTRRGRRLD